MTLIRISERFEEAGTHKAVVSFEHGEEYPVVISNSFATEEEILFEWYFERHLRRPFVDQVKARKAAESINSYGENLFAQIFHEKDIYARYREIVQAGLNTLQIEIAGSPGFHQIHWEALKDPKLPHPLALQAIIVRKNLTPQVICATPRLSPTINILIITARPLGERDIGYRTISRPIVEALRQTSIPVKIDILRPGTYEALDIHLRTITSKYGTGYYHVIHFDVHGAIMKYDQLQQVDEFNNFLYGTRYGRMDIQFYEGEKAFIFLEKNKSNMPDLVEAAELAGLLVNHQIPIAILNACQSGKETRESGASLGSHLIKYGVQLVLAMSYSVTVSAAQLMMCILYQQLFNGQNILYAIRNARQELYNQKQRRAFYNQMIDLEDWLLPVIYQNQIPQLRLSSFTKEDAREYYEQEFEKYTAKLYSRNFIGRDLDILQIEKHLLENCNVILIQGMAGVGKTALLQYLGEWWQQTGFIQQVFYFDFREKSWNRQQIIDIIAKKVLSITQYTNEYQSSSLDAQQSMLTHYLRAQHHLLILDSLDSIIDTELSDEGLLLSSEPAAIRRLLIDLLGGRTFVLLGSQRNEIWLSKESFANNIYNLSGLDQDSISIMIDHILPQGWRVSNEQDEDLQKLIRLSLGFPLVLEALLPSLNNLSPLELFIAIQTGNPSLELNARLEKSENILSKIEIAYSHLSSEAQKLLICLAPFSLMANARVLEGYFEYLREQPALSTWHFEIWQQALKEASDQGLISLASQANTTFFSFHPMFAYYLRLRLRSLEIIEIWQSVQISYRKIYSDLATELFELLEANNSDDRWIGQTLVSLEYENIEMALNLGLTSQDSIIGIYLVLYSYLSTIHDYSTGLRLCEMILSKLQEYSDYQLTGPLGQEYVGIIDGVAKWHLHLKHFEKAEAFFKKALHIHQNLNFLPAALSKSGAASIYHNLGNVANEQRKWEDAKLYYEQALEIFVNLGIRDEQADIFRHLGDLAREQRQWKQAEQNYQQSQQLFFELNDRYNQARNFHCLGAVAQELRQWPKAEEYYRRSLQIKAEEKYHYAMAETFHQLGYLFQEQYLWDKAEEYYLQALHIYNIYEKPHEQASTYHNLGIVMQMQSAYEEAEHYYKLALQIRSKFNEHYELGKDYSQMGILYEDQKKYDQAEQYYQKGLKIFIDYNDLYEEAKSYIRLGNLIQIQKKWDESEQYYRRALQIFTDKEEKYWLSGAYYHLGILALEQKKWQSAQNDFISALEILINHNNVDDDHSILFYLAQIWQINKDNSLITSLVSILDIPQENIEELLSELTNEEKRREEGFA